MPLGSIPSSAKKKKKKRKEKLNQPRWYELIIPVLGRLRQEDLRFEASLSYLVRTCFNIKNKK